MVYVSSCLIVCDATVLYELQCSVHVVSFCFDIVSIMLYWSVMGWCGMSSGRCDGHSCHVYSVADILHCLIGSVICKREHHCTGTCTVLCL